MIAPVHVLMVIVNYRTAALVEDCLASLRGERASVPGMAVVVADAASGDDSVPRLRRTIEARGDSDWVTLLPLEQNGGFAYGNNEAVRRVVGGGDLPQFTVLLNPDTYIRPGAIASLVEFMMRSPQAAIVGARLEDPDGTPQVSAFRFHGLRSELNDALRLGVFSRMVAKHVVAMPPADEPCPVEWVAGACMGIRREVLEAIGLLDEGYFMYFEEVDFCRRAAEAGFETWYFPGARVVHLVGQASGVTDVRSAPKRRPAYWFASRRRYFLRHHGRAKTFLIDLLWAMGHPLFRLRRAMQGRPSGLPPYLWRDFVVHNLLRPWAVQDLTVRADLRNDGTGGGVS